MKKMMFGNSLMLLGIVLLIFSFFNKAFLFLLWPGVILVLIGFIMSVSGFVGKDK